MMTAANAAVTYVAQLRNELFSSFNFTAGTGEAADVNLAAGTTLDSANDTALAAQSAAVYTQPASVQIQGAGSLALVSPAAGAGSTRTFTLNPFVNNPSAT